METEQRKTKSNIEMLVEFLKENGLDFSNLGNGTEGKAGYAEKGSGKAEP